MDFQMDEDRRMIADTLARFVGDRLPPETRNHRAYGEIGFDRPAWAELAKLGMVGALFDGAAGGYGGAGFDIAVLFEELGRALVVEPFLPALMVGRALAAAGGQADRLAAIVSGEAVVAFAHGEAGSDPDAAAVGLRAERAAGGWTLSGAKAVVAAGGAADLLLVSARTSGEIGERDGVSLFVVRADAPGLSVRDYLNIDGGRSADLLFQGVAVGDEALVGEEGRAAGPIDAAIASGLLALSAEALGAMSRARDMTLDYLRTRQQFGVPIGRFQALQHRMADLLLEVEQMRSAVINAAEAFDGDDARRRDRMLAAAKYSAGRIGRLVAEEAVQMHGGIGMTWEMPLAHYAKRLVMIDHLLGDEDWQLQRFIALGRQAEPA